MLKRLLLLVLALPLMALASDFSLTDTKGQVHTLAGHSGKWVLLNLWATWCPPCLAEMPELEVLSRANADLTVIGIAIDGQNPGRVAQFAQKLGISYPIVAGNDAMAKQFGARGVPTTILYEPNGRQALVKEGPITRREIEAAIRRAQ